MKTFIRKLLSARTLAPAFLAMSAVALAPATAWSDNTGSDVAEAVTDTAITAQVKTRLLANSNVSGNDIKVNTDEGTVTLSGTVSDDTEKDLAYYIAKSSKGVEDVKNELSVKN